MPQSVLGGAAVIMFSSIVMSGIQLITKEPLNASYDNRISRFRIGLDVYKRQSLYLPPFCVSQIFLK